MRNATKVERKSDTELVSTRVINGPARLVFQSWTQADLFRQWWVPKSFPISLASCELDVRVGGGYRLVFGAGDQSMAFFGRYLEVTPDERLVWTNDEAGEGQGPVTTVTFEERDGKTLVTMTDRHPTKASLDEAIASGSCEGTPETFAQLEALVCSPRRA